ncbi:potassium channel subfamily K member 6-like isoform X1 [Thrips palmi]|uniref:Potassium channel subfamily K member 1 n=1 Tax=Thrips palmi TaxID=161013 RepID=A0A6P9A746_THRPL|nr:potassium channel subfamily K member 6-like isoform X1 [Thrips palmi]
MSKASKAGYEAHAPQQDLESMGALGVRAHVREVMGMRRSSALLLLFVFFYVGYLVAGGLVFATIEAPAEAQLKASLLRARQAFLEKHPCVSDLDLEMLLNEVVWAADRGVSAVNNVTGHPNWSFGQSIFFSSTVVTTIGYGHVTPLSKVGKIFCIVYAIFGIPLTLVLCTALVERLLVPATLLLQWLNARLGHLYQPFYIRLLHLAIIVSLLVSLFLLIPAAVYASLEPEWDYMDALYYCFISLTTIGLGDYIPGDYPGQAYRPLYKVLTTVYLLVGLTFTMLTLAVFCDIPQLNVGLLFLARSDETTNDPEKVRLNQPACPHTQYTQQRVHVRTRLDSPSPEEVTPVHARP